MNKTPAELEKSAVTGDAAETKPAALYYPTGPYRPPSILFKGEGSQLLMGWKKATYIFIDNGEVQALHFDAHRGELFYRGHNVQHLKICPALTSYLHRFEEALATDPRGKALHTAYHRFLAQLLSAAKSTLDSTRAPLPGGEENGKD